MRISRLPLQALPAAAVTIGSFDGVHLGHQQVIRRLIEQARLRALVSVVVTFEPQPREFLTPGDAPARLTSLSDKARRLAHLGVDHLVVLPFNAALRSLSAQAFVEQILQDKLSTRWLQIGDDFHFGADRAGNFEFLQHFDFEVTDLPSLCVEGQRISSTQLRDLIAQHQLTAVPGLLGEPYTLSGRVIYGRQLGRTIGVPTANLLLAHHRLATEGVFAVTAVIAGRVLQGVANLGTKPTVGDSRYWLEVHFFDFDGVLYGHRISVQLHKRLRGIETFASLDALKIQIQHDMQAAHAWFAQPMEVKRTDD
ncbi:bifunctional riboflavin kinase/FAD synthetase [Reinekea sp.]|jgi:riboflavin kinase/FMN adenylyltransferase|uniref:bifunctional riboflavin kinase/FAD synthetase n=1 Tax=Reinekea sp. TaxID=1970455 RepID=UPI002A8127A0|nr:bifunctional riboflavin kinase/FAD synthetase [Reinekea sp.]